MNKSIYLLIASVLLIANSVNAQCVGDVTPPSITCQADVSVGNDAGQCSANITLVPPAVSDNCHMGVPVLDQSVTTANNTWNTGGYYVAESFTAGASGNLGQVSLNVNTPGTGSITIYSGADVCGPVLFTGPANFKVGWNDYTVTGVAVTAGNVYTIQANSNSGTVFNLFYNGGTAHTGSVLFWSSCGNGQAYFSLLFKTWIGYVPLYNNYFGNNFPVGTTPVTWTAQDSVGNSSTCIQNVIVTDTAKPTIACGGPVSANTDAGQCTATINLVPPVVTDNCGVSPLANPSVTSHDNSWNTGGYYVGQSFISPTTGPFSKLRINFATGGTGSIDIHSGYDVCGPVLYSVPATFTGGWNDFNIPGLNVTAGNPYTFVVNSSNGTVINMYDPNTVNGGNIYWSSCGNSANFGSFTFEAYIGVSGITSDHPSTAFSVGVTTVNWTVTDIHGNTDTCSQQVTVTDLESPVITGNPGDFTTCSTNPTWPVLTATDNCGMASFIADHASGSAFSPGTTLVTYTAIDIHGNTSTTTFNVTVVDNSNFTLSLTSGADSICSGNSVQLNTTISGIAGIGDTVYNWAPPAVTGANPLVSPAGSATYSVTVTYSGCTATASKNIVVNPSPAVNVTGPAILCGGSGLDTLDAGIHQHYIWSTGDTTETVVFTNTTNYSITVTDADRCSASTSGSVIVGSLPKASISPAGPVILCAGTSTTLSVGGFGSTSFLNSPNGNGTQVTCNCPTGYVVVGYTGRNGGWLDQFSLACKKLNANGTLGSTIVYTSSNGSSNGGGANGPYILPGNNVLVGLEAFNGCCGYLSGIDGFGQSISYVTGNGDNTVSPSNGGLLSSGGISLGTLWVPNGSVATGMTSWNSPFAAGVSLNYMPIADLNDQFKWSTGDTTSTIQVSTGGIFSVTVTNSSGCNAASAPDTVILKTVTITINGDSTLCFGDSVSLTASSGTSYLWSTGDTTQSITVSSTAIYQVTVDGCASINPANIFIKPQLVINLNGPSTICPGYSEILSSSFTGTYLWSTGDTTNSITINAAATYSVTVSGNDGCTGTASQAILEQPLTPVAFSSQTNFMNCPWFGGADINIITDPRYSSYSWSTGDNTSEITVFSAGTDSVTVSDALGCSVTGGVTITNPPGDTSVFGNNIWISYAWNAGDQQDFGNSWINAYSGYFIDSFLSFRTEDNWPIFGSPSDAPGWKGCTVSPTNNSWSAKRHGFPCGLYQIDIPEHDDEVQLFINGVKVFEHIGCCDSHTNVWTGLLDSSTNMVFRVTQGGGGADGWVNLIPLGNIAVAVSGNTNICNGQSVTLTASGITNGGYLWSTGDTSASIIVTTSGTYTVSVTNPSGCGAASVPVVVNAHPSAAPLPVIAASPDSVICDWSPVTLSAGSYAAYVWNTGATSPSISVANSGNYWVIVTDSVGCTDSAFATIQNGLAPPAPITTNDTVCPNSVVTLTAKGLAPGGQVAVFDGISQYIEVDQALPSTDFTIEMWVKTTASETGIFSVGDGTLGSNGHDRHLYLTGGQLWARVYSASGWNTGVTINDGKWHHIAWVVQSGVGQTIYVDGNAAPNSYYYDHSDFTWNSRFQIGFSNDASSQFFQGSIDNVRIWSVPFAQSDVRTNMMLETPVTLNNLFYFATLNGDSNAVVGLPGIVPNGLTYAPADFYTYTWTGTGAPAPSTSETQVTAPVPGATTFTVTASPGHCVGAPAHTVVTMAQGSVGGPNLVCPNDSIYITAFGGAAGYLWSTGDTTQTIKVLTAGIYGVTTTYTGGCSFTAADTVAAGSLPLITSCPGNVTVSNDAGQCGAIVNYAAAVAPGDTITYSQNGGTLFNVGTTVVTVTATTACGSTTCTFNVIVNDNELPTISCPSAVTVPADSGLCYATNVLLGNPVTADNCGVSTVTNNAPVQFPVGNTTVTWTVTDVNSNINTCTQIVTVTGVAPSITCAGNVSITGMNLPQMAQGCAAHIIIPSPAVQTNCSIASVTNSFNHTGNATGIYPVGVTNVLWTVTDNHALTNTCTQVITVYSCIHIAGTVTNTICNGTSNGAISVIATGGTPPYNYAWSNGGNTAAIAGLAAGPYRLTVTDATSGSATALFNVGTTTPPKPASPGVITGPATSCAGSTNTYSIAAVTGATSYAWVAGPNMSIISGQGTRQITVQFLSGFGSGTIKVSAVNCGGTSSPNTLAIARSARPASPVSVIGPAFVCIGDTITYTTTAVAGATGYTWTVTANEVIISGQGTIQVQVKCLTGFVAGRVLVAAFNCAGQGGSRSLNIGVRRAPSKPSAVSGRSKICVDSTYRYSIPPLSAATSYTWTVPPLASIISGQGSTSIRVQFASGYTSGVIYVHANNCAGAGPANSELVKAVHNCGVAKTDDGEEASIEPVQSEFKVSIYPNPFADQFHLKVESSGTGDISFKIFDLEGQVIMERKQTGAYESDINFGDSFASGMYIVQVQQGENSKILRVIKSK